MRQQRYILLSEPGLATSHAHGQLNVKLAIKALGTVTPKVLAALECI
jgi:hypothetical protein